MAPLMSASSVKLIRVATKSELMKGSVMLTYM